MAFVPPDPGELDVRVAAVARIQAPTAGGGLAESYATVATVRARLRSLFGSRTIEGEQTTERATHVFTIRARAGGARLALPGGPRPALPHPLRPRPGPAAAVAGTAGRGAGRCRLKSTTARRAW